MKERQIEEILKVFTFSPDCHWEKEIIWITFPYPSPKQKEYIQFLKQDLKAKWSNTNKKWYVQDTTQYRIRYGLEIKYYRNKTLQEIHPNNHLALKKMVDELKLKSYSPNTIRTYTNEFVQLLKILNKLRWRGFANRTLLYKSKNYLLERKK